MDKLSGQLIRLDFTVDWLVVGTLAVEGLHDARITMRLSDHIKHPIGQTYSIRAFFSDVQYSCEAIMVSSDPINMLATFENTSEVEVEIKTF